MTQTTRFIGATLWILVGGALAGGVYWGFLNTPESSVGSLVLSAVLVLLALAVAGVTLNGAIGAWSGQPALAVGRRALAHAAGIIPALVIVLLIWWIAGYATGRVGLYSGEISAWFIARFGREDISVLFTTISWLTSWLRWVVAPLLALSLMASIGAAGWASAWRATWLRAALSPGRLVLSTLWFSALVAAPWVYLAPWRPRGLPATSVEIAFIAAKLLVTAVLMAMGLALMIREVARKQAS
ncbi:MAG: hypothetical protein ABI665_06095 [Vicinamibacterales bacterium]